MKLEIIEDKVFGNTRILLDGILISHVRKYTLEHDVNGFPLLTLEIIPNQVKLVTEQIEAIKIMDKLVGDE